MEISGMKVGECKFRSNVFFFILFCFFLDNDNSVLQTAFEELILWQCVKNCHPSVWSHQCVCACIIISFDEISTVTFNMKEKIEKYVEKNTKEKKNKCLNLYDSTISSVFNKWICHAFKYFSVYLVWFIKSCNLVFIWIKIVLQRFFLFIFCVYQKQVILNIYFSKCHNVFLCFQECAKQSDKKKDA